LTSFGVVRWLVPATPRDAGSFSTTGTTVFDTETRLWWQRNANLGTTWDDAARSCAALRLDQRTWRLPSVAELTSIVNYGGSVLVDPIFWGPGMDYWADRAAADAGAFRVNFTTAAVAALDPTPAILYASRCVSTDDREPEARFRDAGAGVTDLITQLTWADLGGVGGQLPASCFMRCGALAGGVWRLPTLPELLSLHDYGLEMPRHHRVFSLQSAYWSATPNPAQAGQFFYSEPRVGTVSYAAPSTGASCICVR
jgi:hypothetical protein